MAWIQSHQELIRNPKTMRTGKTLGISVITVMGHLHALWHWCLDFAQDGCLSDYSADEISAAVLWEGDPKAFVKALTENGFLIKEDGELMVFGWHSIGGRVIEQRQQSAERQATYRKRQRTGGEGETAIPQAQEESNALRNGYEDGDVTVTAEFALPLRNVREKRREEKSRAPLKGCETRAGLRPCPREGPLIFRTAADENAAKAARDAMTPDRHAPFLEGKPDRRFETEHFLAVCAACGINPAVATFRGKGQAAAAAVILEEAGYSPEQIILAGERCTLKTAMTPGQLQDRIQALLNQKDTHERQSGMGAGDSPASRAHRSRQALMRQLAGQFGRPH